MYSYEFETKLRKNHYKKVDSGDAYIHTYISNTNGARRIVGVIDSHSCERLNGYYLNTVRNSLMARYNTGSLLYVIFTNDSYGTRMRVAQNYSHWIYNEADNRLQIYEDQPGQFFDVNRILEDGYKYTYNSIVNITNIIIFLNVVIYLGLYMYTGGTIRYSYYDYGAPSAYSVFELRQYYRIVVGMFMHSGIRHLAGNMIMLYFVGSRLEQVMGRLMYFIIYFAGGIAAGLCALTYYSIQGADYVVCIGASGAIFAVIGAMVYVLIVHRDRVYDMSLKGMIIYIVLSIVYGMSTPGISLSAHIGGLIAGFVIAAAITAYFYSGRKKG